MPFGNLRQTRGKYQRVATKEDQAYSSGNEDQDFDSVHLSSGESDHGDVLAASIKNGKVPESCWTGPTRRAPKQTYSFMEDLLDPRAAPAKLFYLVHAIGGGFFQPFVPVYFRQLGLTAADVGILVSLPSFVSLWAAPLWSAVADKYRCVRMILVLSTLCYTLFYSLLYTIPPAVRHGYCLEKDSSCVSRLHPHTIASHSTPSVGNATLGMLSRNLTTTGSHWIGTTGNGTYSPRNGSLSSTGVFPTSLTVPVSVNGSTAVSHVDPKKRTRAFMLSALLVILALATGGAMHSTSDAAVLELVDHGKAVGESRYGRQRLWGAVGYAVGNAVSGSWSGANSDKCGGGKYSVHVGGFVVFMTLGAAIGGLCLFPKNESRNAKSTATPKSSEPVQFKHGLKMIFSHPRAATVFLALLSVAITRGADSFVVWFLKDLCASETLIGWSLFMVAASEVLMFSISDKIIAYCGHVRTLCIVFGVLTLRTGAYTLLSNPYWVLPLEVLRGLAWSLTWSCAVQYVRRVATPGLETTMQGILSAILHGIGSAIGSIGGGIVYQATGPRVVFGLSCLWCLVCGVLFVVAHHIIDRREQVQRSEAEENIFLDSDEAVEFDQGSLKQPAQRVQEADDESVEFDLVSVKNKRSLVQSSAPQEIELASLEHTTDALSDDQVNKSDH